MGCSESVARKGIYRLIKHGFIHANYEGKGKRIELVPLVVMGGGTEMPGGVAQKCQGGGTEMPHNNNIKEELNIYNNNEHPIIIKGNEKKESNLNLTVDSPSEAKIAAEILAHFFEVYKKKPTSKKKVANLSYWLEEYSVEDIKQAITNSYQDSFWRGVLDRQGLELLFRKQKAQQGTGNEVEKVDRIGQMLSMKIQTKIRALTEMEFYELAKKLNVPSYHLKKRYDSLMEMVEQGKFNNTDDLETVSRALERWIEKDISLGYITYCNEVEKIDLEDLHPKNILSRKFIKKEREFNKIKDEFEDLKAEISKLEGKEKEEAQVKLKELGLAGKKVQSEYKEIRAEVIKMKAVYDN